MGEQVRVQEIIDAYLLRYAERPGEFNDPGTADVLHDAVDKGRQQGIPVDPDSLIEYLWGLFRLGLLATPVELPDWLNKNCRGLRFRRFIVTERGRRLLAQKAASPHNPSRYLQSIRARVSSPDPIALTYIEEAIGSWEAGVNRAAAIMTGCACERLVLLLADAVVAAPLAPWSSKIEEMRQKGPASVSKIFDQVRGALLHPLVRKALPDDMGDALDRKLSSIFDHVRILRNQAGHPTGEEVSAEDAEAGLLMFPGFYVYVDRLLAHLGTMKGP